MALTIWFLAFLALQNYNFSIVFANFQCLDELADETFEVEESNFFMESLKNGDFGDPNDPEIKQLMCDLSDQERMLESAAPMPPATIHPIFDKYYQKKYGTNSEELITPTEQNEEKRMLRGFSINGTISRWLSNTSKEKKKEEMITLKIRPSLTNQFSILKQSLKFVEVHDKNLANILHNIRRILSNVKEGKITVENNVIRELKNNLDMAAKFLAKQCHIPGEEIVPLPNFDNKKLIKELAKLWFQEKWNQRKRKNNNDQEQCNRNKQLVQLIATLNNDGGDWENAKNDRRRRKKRLSKAVLWGLIFVLGLVAATFVCWRINRCCNPKSAQAGPTPAGGGGSASVGSAKIELPASSSGSQRWTPHLYPPAFYPNVERK